MKIGDLGLNPNAYCFVFYSAQQPERWQPIPGTNGLYEASTYGRIKSHHKRGRGKKGKLMNATPNKAGYPVVKLTLPHLGKQETRYVHELVMLTFIGPRPKGAIITHYDDVKTNNKIGNLQYSAPAMNFIDRLFNTSPYRRKAYTGVHVAVMCAYTGEKLLYLGDVIQYPELFHQLFGATPGYDEPPARAKGERSESGSCLNLA